MTTKRAQLGIIFLTILIDMIGFGIVIPVLPLYAEHYGATAQQNGLLVAVFSLAQFLFAPLWGKVSDRVGRKPVLFVSILGSAIGFLLMGTAGALWMLFVARVIDGAAGGNIGTAQAYIADISTPEERARAMGLIGAAFGLGFMFGPAIGGLMSWKFGYQSPMLLAAGLALANAFLVLAILPESLPADRRGIQRRSSIFEVLQHCNRRVYLSVTAIYFFLTTGFSMMTFVYALFVSHRFGIGTLGTGNLLALVGLIGVVIQGGLIGRLVKRCGEARLATSGALILAASLFALPLATGLGTLVLYSAGVAVGNSLLMPTLTSLASRSVDGHWQGRALGLLQSGGALARWVGPAVGGCLLALDVSRHAAVYARTPLWLGSALVAFAWALTLLLPRKTAIAPLPADEPTTA
ncbi:MAG: MFS transporter [Terrimicrobiaceae bacterium]|nr:MFS transporter [Terrimicrobiaceae bacterium]